MERSECCLGIDGMPSAQSTVQYFADYRPQPIFIERLKCVVDDYVALLASS